MGYCSEQDKIYIVQVFIVGFSQVEGGFFVEVFGVFILVGKVVGFYVGMGLNLFIGGFNEVFKVVVINNLFWCIGIDGCNFCLYVLGCYWLRF